MSTCYNGNAHAGSRRSSPVVCPDSKEPIHRNNGIHCQCSDNWLKISWPSTELCVHQSNKRQMIFRRSPREAWTRTRKTTWLCCLADAPVWAKGQIMRPSPGPFQTGSAESKSKPKRVFSNQIIRMQASIKAGTNWMGSKPREVGPFQTGHEGLLEIPVRVNADLIRSQTTRGLPKWKDLSCLHRSRPSIEDGISSCTCVIKQNKRRTSGKHWAASSFFLDPKQKSRHENK